MDFYSIDIHNGDVLILCSDGLSNMIEKDAIFDTINNNSDDSMDEVCNLLVELAKDNGGKDNITVIGIKFDDEVLI